MRRLSLLRAAVPSVLVALVMATAPAHPAATGSPNNPLANLHPWTSGRIIAPVEGQSSYPQHRRRTDHSYGRNPGFGFTNPFPRDDPSIGIEIRDGHGRGHHR